MPARSGRSRCRRRPACILNAPKPAPVCIRHVIGQMLPDVVFGCLRQIIPDRVPAEGTSCLWNLNVRGETQSGAGGNYGFIDGGDVERRHRRAARQGRALGHRLSERRARHAGRDRREPDAADLLEEGAAAGLRRRRAHAGRARADHRDRAAASTGRGTSSRRSTASIIRRAAATVGATARPVMSGSSPGKQDARQGLSGHAAGRPAGGAHAGRRRHRRAERSARPSGSRAISRTSWSRKKRHGICMATRP